MDKVLVARLPVYPAWAADTATWLHPKVATRVMQSADSEGWARDDDWAPGLTFAPKPTPIRLVKVDPALERIIDRATAGKRLDEPEIVRLFAARDIDYDRVITVADELRKAVSGNTVRYVVNRNINYTNICYYKCKFCAFSKGKTHEALRGTPYDLEMGEIVRRSQEAWDRGATEVCLQGGIHPDYTGETYIAICEAIKAAIPGMHIHAFSPLEVTQGAATLGLTLTEFLTRLKDAGLGTLPGTAAEILDDEIRAIICPDKINTQQWVDVARAAHALGLRTTSTIMYGHVESPLNWARHLLVLRDCKPRPAASPNSFLCRSCIWKLRCTCAAWRAKAPTTREAILMHAVARLVLNPLITNIQTSWVKMGPQGAAMCLNAGANDMGGTLMNESISRAAGTEHGQEFPPEAMENLIGSIVRTPTQRDTLYRPVGNERRVVSFNAPELTPVVQTPPRKVLAAE